MPQQGAKLIKAAHGLDVNQACAGIFALSREIRATDRIGIRGDRNKKVIGMP
jgi:hypothetical protein